MKGYLYILECADGSYYTGSTNNMELRLQQHQNGEGANHTRKRLPVKLLYTEEYDRIDTAFYREKQVQGWSRAKKEALMEGRIDDLQREAECKNETHFQNGPSATLRPRAGTQITAAEHTKPKHTEAERSRSQSYHFQKYPAYKNSGVEWVGEIPEHWALRRFKYLFKELNERSSDGTEDLLSVSQYTGVTRKGDKVEEGDLLTNASTLEGYKKVQIGDLVTNIMLAWNGSLGFSPFEGITSPAYSIYRLQGNNEERYFHYLLRTDRYKAEFKRNSSGVIESRLRLYSDDFFRILSLLPPKEEQTAIANFLNEKCGKIDTAIAQKEKLIALLKERKQIIIQNAVTGQIIWSEKEQKMIPRSLSGVEGKDSGVEWIGEIPEHWDLGKVKYFSRKISKGTTPSTEGGEVSNEGPIRYIKAENIQNGLITDSPAHFINEKTNQLIKRSELHKDDILFVIAGATLGKVAILGENHTPANTNQAVAFIRPNNKVIPQFLSIWLTSSIITELIWLDAVQSAQPNLSMEDLGNFPIFKLPLEEQSKIVEYINTSCLKINNSIDLQKQQIDKLKEFKSSIIDTAVTGKIKVN